MRICQRTGAPLCPRSPSLAPSSPLDSRHRASPAPGFLEPGGVASPTASIMAVRYSRRMRSTHTLASRPITRAACPELSSTGPRSMRRVHGEPTVLGRELEGQSTEKATRGACHLRFFSLVSVVLESLATRRSLSLAARVHTGHGRRRPSKTAKPTSQLRTPPTPHRNFPPPLRFNLPLLIIRSPHRHLLMLRSRRRRQHLRPRHFSGRLVLCSCRSHSDARNRTAISRTSKPTG